MAGEDRSFLSRWSQRKSQARSGVAVPEPPPQAPAEELPPAGAPHPDPAAVVPAQPAPAAPAPPPVTMADVAALDRSSDYSRFVAPGVDPGVRNAAMRKLFSDPHFNVMDGLDIYIDDYSQPDPIPAEMLRRMVQSQALRLFDDDEKEQQQAAPERTVPAAGPVPVPPQPPAPPSGIAAAGSGTADNRVHDDHTDLQLQPDDAAGRSGPDEGAGPGRV